MLRDLCTLWIQKRERFRKILNIEIKYFPLHGKVHLHLVSNKVAQQKLKLETEYSLQLRNHFSIPFHSF